MANTWIARDHRGNTVEFRSSDFDALELADELFTPFEIRDKTDGLRPVGIVKDEPLTGSVKVEWYDTADWLSRCS